MIEAWLIVVDVTVSRPSTFNKEIRENEFLTA